MSVIATERPRDAVPLLEGLAELADDYDGYVLDLWGVLHDGLRAFPAAIDCLQRLRARGKQILILSNAPRRTNTIAARCRELGIAPEHYDLIMSSGEEAWCHLKDRPDAWYRALGRRCYHLGPDRDHGMREGLDYDFVEALAEADFILNTGALNHEDTAETYTPFLEEALAQGLPMVCANPDLVVLRGERMEICAGTVADCYAELGGEVRYHGKPHAAIYRTCLGLFDGVDPRRILAVGDSLRTDVLGAQRAGLHSVFIVSGIHGEELIPNSGGPVDMDALAGLCSDRGAWPQGALVTFTW